MSNIAIFGHCSVTPWRKILVQRGHNIITRASALCLPSYAIIFLLTESFSCDKIICSVAPKTIKTTLNYLTVVNTLKNITKKQNKDLLFVADFLDFSAHRQYSEEEKKFPKDFPFFEQCRVLQEQLNIKHVHIRNHSEYKNLIELNKDQLYAKYGSEHAEIHKDELFAHIKFMELYVDCILDNTINPVITPLEENESTQVTQICINRDVQSSITLNGTGTFIGFTQTTKHDSNSIYVNNILRWEWHTGTQISRKNTITPCEHDLRDVSITFKRSNNNPYIGTLSNHIESIFYIGQLDNIVIDGVYLKIIDLDKKIHSH